MLGAVPPCDIARTDGAHDTLKFGPTGAAGVASTQALAGPKHAEEAPAATTL